MQGTELLVQLQTELAVSKERYSGIKQQIDGLYAKCTEVEKQFSKLTTKYEIHNSIIINMAERYKEFQKSLSDITSLYTNLHEKFILLESRLTDVVENNKYLLTTDKDVQQKVRDVVRDYMELHEQIETLGSQIEEVNHKLEPLDKLNYVWVTFGKWAVTIIGALAAVFSIWFGLIQVT